MSERIMKLDKKYVLAYWITFATYIIVFVVLMLSMGYEYNSSLSNVWIKRAGLIILLLGWFVWYIGRRKLGTDSVDIDPLGELARIILHPKRKHIRYAPENIVDNGIYRRMRHPQYWGTVAFYIGISIALESIPGLITSIIIVLPAHLWRAKIEEKMLERIFGHQYIEYMGKVKV